MQDRLRDEQAFRTFNVLDDYKREGLGIEVDLSLPAARVIRTLERIYGVAWRSAGDSGRQWTGVSQCPLPGLGAVAGHYPALYPAREATAKCLRRALQSHAPTRVAQ